MKYNWNSTRKTRKKVFWALSYKILPPEITKIWEIWYFWVYFWGLGTNVEFNGFVWFCEFLKVSASIKNSFNFEVGFFTYFEYISGAIIRKYILRSDYDSARWYWCKKDQKNLPETSNQFFSQCFIFSQCLWAFTVQSVCKNSFSGCKRRKKWYSCNKNPIFFAKSPPELQVSMS